MIDKFGTKWVEIDLDVLERNIRRIQKYVFPARMMAVVKADAYGHGAVEVAQAAARCGVRTLGVSCLEEAVDLRRNFITGDIVIFGAVPESQICDILNYDLSPTVCTPRFGQALSREACRLNKRINVHVCVDTGDGRFGPPADQAPAFVRRTAGLKNLRLAGLYSHFSTADDPKSAFSALQKKRFDALADALRQAGVQVPCLHLANSGGVLNVPGSHYDMVRTGLLMYGIYPCARQEGHPEVKSVFSLKARVVFQKSVGRGFTVSYGRKYVTRKATDIVTLPLGYADGFPRKFSNRGQVILRKRRLPVVGAVCMDMIMVDAGRRSGVKTGDEAVIIGRQGREEISVYDLSRDLGTIPYEVICNIGKRVTRVYRRDGQVFSVKRMISAF